MASGLITKRAVDAAGVPEATTFLWDTEVRGFGLKVTPAGGRSYVYQYRLGGRAAKVQRHTIGPHGPWTPDAARKEAKRLAQLVDTGVDLSAARKAKHREAVELAFAAYAERFIIDYLVPHWKGGHELATGILRRDIIPAFRGKTLKQISRGDVSALMDRLATKPATRRNAFAALRRLFRWAVNRGDIDVSPIRDMDPPPAPASRDRVLSDDELRQVWRATAQLGYPFEPFVQLLILTGQRREEVAALDWRELDRKDARWTLPAERAKNHAVHEVPLSEPVIALLDQIACDHAGKAESGAWPQTGLILTTTGTTSITGYSVAKKRIDAYVAAQPVDCDWEVIPPRPIANWRFHDLRRTLATGLQRLGVRFEVTEAVLNHVSGARSGVAGVYQRYNWNAEKRAALNGWGEHIGTIVMLPMVIAGIRDLAHSATSNRFDSASKEASIYEAAAAKRARVVIGELIVLALLRGSLRSD